MRPLPQDNSLLPDSTGLTVSRTSAKMLPDLVPRNIATGDVLQSHMVDFCLTIEPNNPHNMLKLLSMDAGPPTINQTTYEPMCLRPIAVAIETKTEKSPVTGRNQLAIWTKAWLNRINAFVPSKPPPPLPLLRIIGHSWFIMFAWEEEPVVTAPKQMSDPFTTDTSDDEPGQAARKKLVLMGDVLLGDTRSLIGIYKLLKGLRRLAAWANKEFREWFDNAIEEAVARQI